VPNRRITAVLCVILLAFAAVEVRLLQLQVVRGEHYATYADRQRVGLLPLDAARARIITSDGVVLAEDRRAFDIVVVIGRLDPSGERRIRTPLRRLFYVPRREEVLRIVDTGFELHPDPTDPARRIVRAWSKLRVKIRGEDGRPDVDLVDRHVEFPLPERVAASVDRLAALTGEEPADLLDKVVTAAIDVARLRVPVSGSVPIAKDVAYETVARVETRPDLFRGFEVRARFARAAPEGPLAPHLIGYVAPFNPRDVEAAIETYRGWPRRGFFLTQRIGRAGIEKTMDGVLRGEFGMECVERDHMNRRQRVLADAPPNPGRDVILTLDSRLQKLTEEALEGVVGAIVFLDARTGRVLAIASSPSYDPARFRQDYAALADNPDRPLWDRSVRGRLPLGSVFKVVTALAALEKGCVPASVDCQGAVRLGRRSFRCHRRYGHGPEDLTNGIQHSCNVFFYRTAQRVGDADLIAMAYRLGFGRETGIRIPGEYGGNVPHRAAGGELLNLAIGQGKLLVTPLQVARMMAVVANDGVLVPPRIIEELRPFDSEEPAAVALPDAREPRDLKLAKRSIDAVRLGLYKATNEYGGTSFRAFRGFARPFQICGKTSTAQRSRQPNLGWFAGYAPHAKPRIAFAVVIEGLGAGQGGGSTAAPLARRIFESIPLELLGLEPAEEGGD